MKSTSRQLVVTIWLISLILLVIFPIGCGKEDLYEIPESPYPEIGRLPLPSVNKGVSVMGDYAFVAAGQAGLHVVDISVPSSPVLIKTLNTTKYAESIEVVRTFWNQELRDIALIIEGTEGVTTWDITDPPNTVSYNQATTAVNANGIFIKEGDHPDDPFTLYLAEGWKGLRVLESNIGFPGVIDYNGVFSNTLGEAKQVEVKGGYAYVADDQMGLVVVDVRILDLGTVQVVSWADTPGNALGVSLWGDYAYVADKRQGLSVFRINGGETPEHVAQLPLDSWCLDIEVRDGLAFIAADDAGLHVVDVSDPENPVYAGNTRTPNATGVCVSANGLILVTDEDDGLFIMQGPNFIDDTAPARVYSLEADSLSFVRVALSWYPTGDDGYKGQASSYDIRYSTDPIDDEVAWAAATPIPGLPAPEAPGTRQTFELTGLNLGTQYHFATKMTDDGGQSSDLSPLETTSTMTDGVWLRSDTLSPPFGGGGQTFTYETMFMDADNLPPATHDVVIDGERFEMTYISGEYNDNALYRYQTQLAVGPHGYYFDFVDQDGATAPATLIDGPYVGTLFTMGSPSDELGRDDDETQHVVGFGGDIEAELYEVTQGQWIAVTGEELPDASFPGDDLPVVGVTWQQATDYCNALSLIDGLTPVYSGTGDDTEWDRDADGWRLPTEAEWEWLCRSGSDTAFSNGDISQLNCTDDENLKEVAWYCWNSEMQTHPIGEKDSNSEGYHDMHGNVMEWCWDWYGEYSTDLVSQNPAGPETGNTRVIRGGSWDNLPDACRSASRESSVPDSGQNYIGFRVVRTLF
jgi:formylglycine-generating enzyme required for sulfatase activity